MGRRDLALDWQLSVRSEPDGVPRRWNAIMSVNYSTRRQKQLMEDKWREVGAAAPLAIAGWKDNADRMVFWGDDPQVTVIPTLVRIQS